MGFPFSLLVVLWNYHRKMKRLVYAALKEPIVRFVEGGGSFKLFNIVIIFDSKSHEFAVR